MKKGQLMWDMDTRIERWLAKKVTIVGTCWQWTGSSSENLYRSDRVGKYNLLKTHCPQNHEYSPENTRITSVGGRTCRACERRRAQRARDRKRGFRPCG